MEALNGTLQLENFYSKEYLQVTGVDQEADKIIIRMKSNVSNCICPKCGHTTTEYHGTYVRKVQDLPILGKTVILEITAHEHNCTNEECTTSTITDDFNGFLNSYSRMTERCADFICTLALETSCEGCARICQKLGIHISGDTVIRLLLKRYEALPDPIVSNVIGVDDFAYKKRHTYGTIIVDEKTHKPITLLDGRDGNSLRNWLKHNKQVKVVTRDRASAYAKVISEVLPDAIQVADRFHLHQNLLEAIKKALNHELPATITIPHEKSNEDVNIPGKKIVSDVDNCPGFSEKRYKMICQIQAFLKEGCSYREIAKRMGVGRNTIAKYHNGDPKELTKFGIRQSKLDPFYDFILQCLKSGWSKSKTVKAIYEKGYTGSKSNAFEHLVKLEEKEHKLFAEQSYKRTMTEGLKYKTGSTGKTADYITREGIFRYMWMNTELSEVHKKYIYQKYPNTFEIHCCIQEFRYIFEKRNVPLLYLFIEKYKNSALKSIRSFAAGLERDIEAVENAVAYDYSNGFVEGTNSRLKMIKRTMYGRCGKRLLEAKLRYMKIVEDG